jgi:hypothetical protein
VHPSQLTVAQIEFAQVLAPHRVVTPQAERTDVERRRLGVIVLFVLNLALPAQSRYL